MKVPNPPAPLPSILGDIPNPSPQMENAVAEKRKQTAVSWLDLHDPLLELVLERLPLADYLRFAAVCRKWRSIQRDHRLRHSPGPPPMPYHPLPCLVPAYSPGSSPRQCYSPFDQKFHSFDLALPAAHHSRCIFSAYGWMVVLSSADLQPHSWPMFLLNPISGVQIQVPTVDISSDLSLLVGALSAPPYDPQCVLLLADDKNIFFYVVSAKRDWAKISITDAAHGDPSYRLASAVFCQGKFYCMFNSFKFYVVDVLLDLPSLKLLKMDGREMPWEIADAKEYSLVESNGDILLVVTTCDLFLTTSFQVYRADFSRNLWVKLENIGNLALFVGYMGAFSLVATDVGIKANCIYYTPASDPIAIYFGFRGEAFAIFDLESMSSISAPKVRDSAINIKLCQLDTYYLHWVLPTLDCIISAEPSNFERTIAKDSNL